MPPLPASTGCLERQIAITSLNGLVAALTRSLASTAPGGAEPERLLAESLEAECVTCGIRVPGSELVAASLDSEVAASVSGRRSARVRLGYCARNTCTSNYYRVRFAPRADVDWDRVWIRIEPLLAAAPERPARERLPWRDLIPESWIEQARRPGPILIVSALALGLFWRAGCRVPGLSPKPRVFIVAETNPAPVPPTGKDP